MNRSYCNILFFAGFFCVLFAIQLFHAIESQVGALVILSSCLQLLLAFVALGMISIFLKKRIHKLLYYSYIGLVFVFFILEALDAILVRYMHLSIWRALSMIFEETLANFVEKICMVAPLWVWVSLIPLALALPLIGVGIYLLTRRFALCYRHLKLWVCIVPLLMIAVDLACVRQLPAKTLRDVQKILTFKRSTVSPKFEEIKMHGELAAPEEVKVAPKLCASSLPNIYFFVAESIRADYFTKTTAPNLYHLGQTNNYIPKMIAGANATQDAWYALFHSTNALSFGTYNQLGRKGALPLRVFKEMGYQIHCHSAAQLNYYNMDRVLFGKDQKLLDEMHVFPHRPPEPTWKSDEKAIGSLIDSIEPSGQVHIIFLDSTHFYYSWSPEFKAPFLPCADEYGKHLTSRKAQAIQLLQNRYKNAIAYVDHLIGKFMTHLKALNLYEEAVIAFHADHGEEMYEEGKLFHASHLSPMQCEVPSILKMGNTRLMDLPKVASHLDVMPTLIEYVSKKPCDFLEGQSLFKKNYSLKAICARDNFSKNPFEFVVYGPHGRLIAELRTGGVRILSAPPDLKVNDLLGQALPSLHIQCPRAAPHMDRVGVQVAAKK